MRFVFFSFNYDDVKNFKVNVVRNSWYMNHNENTFVDGSMWEEEKIKTPTNIKRVINDGLVGTSVTAVLIGKDTYNRRWVKYEIIKSFDKGNGILGININRIRGKIGMTQRGLNPLNRLALKVSNDGQKINFYEIVNSKWRPFEDLPEINNKKSNTIYFGNHWWHGNEYGKTFLFSQLFKTYCWTLNTGHQNFSDWVEEAAENADR